MTVLAAAASGALAVEDLPHTHHGTRPSLLRRWHPGTDVAVEPTPDGRVALDVDAQPADRAQTVTSVHRLLAATASRPAFTRCFDLHEWAVVYRADATRQELPLHLGTAGTDASSTRTPCGARTSTPSASPPPRRWP